MHRFKNLFKKLKDKIKNLPDAKLIDNNLYILNTNGKYIKIKKQKKPEYIEDISELDKYK